MWKWQEIKINQLCRDALTHSVRCHTDHDQSTSRDSQEQATHYQEPILLLLEWNESGSTGIESLENYEIQQEIINQSTFRTADYFCTRKEKYILSSTGQVDGDSPPVFVLCWGIHRALSITSTPNGWGHALWSDEGPVVTTVCGVLQAHTMGEGSGLTAAHAQLKLKERWAGHLKVPALCVSWLLWRHRGKAEKFLGCSSQQCHIILDFNKMHASKYYVRGQTWYKCHNCPKKDSRCHGAVF